MVKQSVAALTMTAALTLGACSILPQNPTNDFRGSVGQVYSTIAVMAAQIGAAQEAGYISTSEEDRLLDALEGALATTRIAESADPEAKSTEETLNSVRRTLAEISVQLRESERSSK